MPTTSDPVSIKEIAERCNVPRDRVKQWRARGLIPDEDWDLGVGGIWAWETLVAEPQIAKHLDPAAYFAHVSNAVAVNVARHAVWYEVDDEQDRPRSATRRIERHGHGWVAIPTADRRRLVVTTDLDELSQPGATKGTASKAQAVVDAALEGLRVLFAAGDWREPAVSTVWS